MRIIKQDLKLYMYQDKICFIDWYKNDESHREDGPSEVWSTGKEYYNLNNINYNEHEYRKKIHENY